jgi:hypothetical protein
MILMPWKGFGRILVRYGGDNWVKTQIWIAVVTCALIASVKKKLHLDTSLHQLLQTLSVSVSRK